MHKADSLTFEFEATENFLDAQKIPESRSLNGTPFHAPHPIPYQGSKRNLAPEILAIVSNRKFRRLYEPFAGSAAITMIAAPSAPIHAVARASSNSRLSPACAGIARERALLTIQPISRRNSASGTPYEPAALRSMPFRLRTMISPRDALISPWLSSACSASVTPARRTPSIRERNS